jgi:RNA-dependent RNA polymerase
MHEGRWITYHFVVDNKIVGTEEQIRVRQILADYNIPVVLDDKFTVLPREEVKAGKDIDPPLHKANAPSSLLVHLDDKNTQIAYDVRYQLEVCISQGYILSFTKGCAI